MPLVTIVGPTASGKTSLALRLAQQYNGEIICADSRTLYREMNIGTAKPTPEEQASVRHWGLDLVDPGEAFSVAQFQQYAYAAIEDIRRRGKTPFLVGGTGLYVDAVLFAYGFGEEASADERTKLTGRSLAELIEYCVNHNISLPENSKNKRYVIRAIERNSISIKRRHAPIDDTLVVGIATNKVNLRTKIVARAEHMFTNGVVEEAKLLGKKYGWDSEAMKGNVYPLVKQFVDGTITQEELSELFSTSDWQLAKRQLTWLRRNPYILWLTAADAEHLLVQKLAQLKDS